MWMRFLLLCVCHMCSCLFVPLSQRSLLCEWMKANRIFFLLQTRNQSGNWAYATNLWEREIYEGCNYRLVWSSMPAARGQCDHFSGPSTPTTPENWPKQGSWTGQNQTFEKVCWATMLYFVSFLFLVGLSFRTNYHPYVRPAWCLFQGSHLWSQWTSSTSWLWHCGISRHKGFWESCFCFQSHTPYRLWKG